jgi:hypothetical protein
VERSIAAPADRIWGLLTDGAGYPGWNPTVISIEGRIAPGEKIALRSTLNPERTFKLRVELMEAPRRMVWSSGMPLGLFKGTRTFTVEPNGDQSRFTMQEVYTGPLAPLITKSIPDMTENFNEFADAVLQAAEASQ